MALRDPVEDLLACTHCGDGPPGHADSGQCLFLPQSTYHGGAEILTWPWIEEFRKRVSNGDPVHRQIHALLASPTLRSASAFLRAVVIDSLLVHDIVHEIGTKKEAGT